MTVDVDASASAFANATAFPPYWKRSFGSGHARLTLRDDWRTHFRLAVDELGMRGVRHHGMFDDDMGPVVVGSTFDDSKMSALGIQVGHPGRPLGVA